MTRILLLLSLTYVTFAQEAPTPAFEVASVKPAAPQQPVDLGGGRFRSVPRGCRKPDPGMITCTSVTMKALLMQAYEVKNYQVDGPAWIDADLFDLNAKIPAGVAPEKVPSMLQALLAERFKVVIRKETRQLPAYELTIAKGGPKMKEVDQAEVAAYKVAQEARKAGGDAPPPPPPPPGGARGPGAPMPMGTFSVMMSTSGARTSRGKMDMPQLVNMIVNQLKRPVIDLTGLKGTYDIELSYMDDANPGFGSIGPPPEAGAAPRPAETDAPVATFSQAVQQTLGLKLEQKKAPLEVIILDSGNKVPTEN